MNEVSTFQIREEADIFEVRMHVRTLARTAGFDLLDQAKISLATSTVAIMLGMARGGGGQITTTCQPPDGEDRPALRVVCSRPGEQHLESVADVLRDAARMVDELQVDASEDRVVRVVLVKWIRAGARPPGNTQRPFPGEARADAETSPAPAGTAGGGAP